MRNRPLVRVPDRLWAGCERGSAWHGSEGVCARTRANGSTCRSRAIWLVPTTWSSTCSSTVAGSGRSGCTSVGERVGGPWLVAWPRALRGSSTAPPGARRARQRRRVYDAEVRFGDGDAGRRRRPAGCPRHRQVARLAQTFDTASAEQVRPLLDSIERCWPAERRGVDAFPAYGTLLGAVRGGALIGHDSDADLGYVSDHTHPVDVVRESFRLQRSLAAMGYRISRYSGGAFKVDVPRATARCAGSTCSRGFLADGHLHLMGEIRAPFDATWSSRSAPRARGSSSSPRRRTPTACSRRLRPVWRVPDPAYKFETPRADPAPAQRLVPRAPASTRRLGPPLLAARRTAAASREPHELARMLRRAGAGRGGRSSTSAAAAAPTTCGSRARAPCRARLLAPRLRHLRDAPRRRAGASSSPG